MLKMRFVLLAGLFATALPSGAQAQATLFDGALLRSACLQAQCVSTVQTEIQGLVSCQMRSDEFNSQLGVMAAILFDAARVADAVAAEQIAQALMLLAQFSTDAAQQNSLLQLASAVADGSIDLFDLGEPFAVSPN